MGRSILRHKQTEMTPHYNGKPALITEHADGRITVELTSMPAVLFVSHDGGGTYDELYLHGDQQADKHAYTISSGIGELTTLELTQHAAVMAVDKTL